MDRKQLDCPTLGAAQRGQIVQHVLVDGWSVAEAARAFAVEERKVAAWVAAFRRRGMASLRGDPMARGPLLRRAMQGMRAAVWRRLGDLGWTSGRREGAPCVVLPRRIDDRGRR